MSIVLIQKKSSIRLNNSKKKNQAAAAAIRVMIRKRPFFPHEEKQKEFDVVTVFEGEGQVVVHDARMKSDMQTM